MKQITAIKRLNQLSLKQRYVFSIRDLEKVFAEDCNRTFKAGINRLVSQGILERATKGVYVFALSHLRNSSNTLELIARTMRRGEYSYISLESALSSYGVISQIPIDRLTIMTTGRKGEHRTPFGTIEFTHTARRVGELVDSFIDVGRPLRMATKQAAWRDLKRVGRNTHLVQHDMLHED